MSNLKDRSRSASRPIIGGNPALSVADVNRACSALVMEARRLVGWSPAATLGVLLEFMSKTRLVCNPSQETLSKRIGCHRDTLVQHLKRLEAAGLLSRVSLPVRRGRRGRESDWYSFAFGRVGRPELAWKPPLARGVKTTDAKPVRAADGTFRRAAAAVGFAELIRRVVVASDVQAVVQAESEAASLDDAPRAQAFSARPNVSGRPWADPVKLAAPVGVSEALAGLFAAMRARSSSGA